MRIDFRAIAALAPVLFAFVACSGSGTAGTGAGCAVDTDCGAPRVCREGLCADPTRGSGTPDPGGSSGGSGTSGSGTPSPEADASTPTIYCGSASSSSCVCGHTTSYGSAGVSCGATTVTGPGLCCAQPGWPSSMSCACYQLACDQYSPDTCICGAKGTLLHPVGSCSAPAGGVCCVGSGAAGTELCACHQKLTQCPPGEKSVSSCSVAALGCTGSAMVAACQ